MNDLYSISKIPRMRTVHEAAEELKKFDSGTAVTEYHIRQLTINNVIPRVKAGKSILSIWMHLSRIWKIR